MPGKKLKKSLYGISKKPYLFVIFVIAGLALITASNVFGGLESEHSVPSADSVSRQSQLPWWAWPMILFAVTFVLGILAVLAGVGGAVLFVPIVSSFFPFHLDFVRGTGLLVALSLAIAAGPGLLKKNIANLRLALSVGLFTSCGAVVGAIVGFALPTNVIQTALGAAILGIVLVMILAKKSEFPEVKKADALSTALSLSGIYYEESSGKAINWKIHRTGAALFVFVGVGFAAGMFGLGAGWANVPVLNLMMGAPLKVAVSTSIFLLSITDSSAAWIYLNKGAVLPIMVVPSVIGIMLGSRIGVKVLTRARPGAIRYIVIAMLLFVGVRALLKGFGI